jgi:hypothetical protein
MIILTHSSNDPLYELGLNKLELYSVLGIVGNFYHCFGCLEYVREGDAGSIDKRH